MNGKTLSSLNQLTIELEQYFDNVDVLINENKVNFSCQYKQDRRQLKVVLSDIGSVELPLELKQDITNKITITPYWVEFEIALK